MIKLFLNNFKVLAMHPSQNGKTKVLEMRIYLVPGAAPYKSRVRPLNPDQKENLPTQINEWLEQRVIEPSVSPWAWPLVPVKKKDGRTRWVTDLRELNKQMVKDSYPLTNIQKILHSLQGATVFSSLDACGAYHAGRIEPGSCACTVFISPFGTFQLSSFPVKILLGRTIPSNENDSSGLGGDQTSVLSWRRKAGESRHAQTVSGSG